MRSWRQSPYIVLNAAQDFLEKRGPSFENSCSPIHCLHDFVHKQDSQLNSSVLITVWRVVIEKSVTELPTK